MNLIRTPSADRYLVSRHSLFVAQPRDRQNLRSFGLNVRPLAMETSLLGRRQTTQADQLEFVEHDVLRHHNAQMSGCLRQKSREGESHDPVRCLCSHDLSGELFDPIKIELSRDIW